MTEPRLTRRTLVGTMAVVPAGTLAGCLGSDEDVPDPIALDGDDQLCDNCNMVVGQHRGPKAQAFYLDDAPTDEIADREDGVAWFCSTWCGYSFVFEQETRDHDPAGMYSTDYSSVDHEMVDDGGATFITQHVQPDDFADIEALTLVVDSDVQGAMGSSLVGFGNSDDAAAFADEHGGEQYEDDDITPELVAALGT